MTVLRFTVFDDIFELYSMDDQADNDTSEIWANDVPDLKMADGPRK